MPTVTSKDLTVNKVWQSTSATDTTLNVTIDPTAPLKLGTYTFKLEVIDDSNNKSAAVQATVLVVDTTPPTALVAPTSQKVSVNQPFKLDGSGSSDAGGGDKIATYVWTLVQFQ